MFMQQLPASLYRVINEVEPDDMEHHKDHVGPAFKQQLAEVLEQWKVEACAPMPRAAALGDERALPRGPPLPGQDVSGNLAWAVFEDIKSSHQPAKEQEGLWWNMAILLTLMATTATRLLNTQRVRGERGEAQLKVSMEKAAENCGGQLGDFFPAFAEVLHYHAEEYLLVTEKAFASFMLVSAAGCWDLSSPCCS